MFAQYNLKIVIFWSVRALDATFFPENSSRVFFGIYYFRYVVHGIFEQEISREEKKNSKREGYSAEDQPLASKLSIIIIVCFNIPCVQKQPAIPLIFFDTLTDFNECLGDVMSTECHCGKKRDSRRMKILHFSTSDCNIINDTQSIFQR